MVLRGLFRIPFRRLILTKACTLHDLQGFFDGLEWNDLGSSNRRLFQSGISTFQQLSHENKANLIEGCSQTFCHFQTNY